MLCVRRCWIVVGAILWEGETLDSVQGMVQVYVIFPVLNFSELCLKDLRKNKKKARRCMMVLWSLD